MSIAGLGVLGLFLRTFLLSFTSYNVLENPKFIGAQNYVEAAKSELVQLALKNTDTMVIVLSVFLILFAVIPALFVSRMKKWVGVLSVFVYSFVSVISIVMAPSTWGYLFSGDAYGALNSFLLSSKVITEPYQFIAEEPMVISIILYLFILIGPVFVVAFLTSKAFSRVIALAVSVGIIPILMSLLSIIIMSCVGYPTVDYAADWLATLIYDYAKVRFEMGFANALLVLGFLKLAAWCAAWWGIALLLKLIFKKPIKSRGFNIVFNIISLVTAGTTALYGVIFTVITVSNSLKPLDELFIMTSSVFVKHPTLLNFRDAVTLLENSSFSPVRGIGFPFVYNLLTALLVIAPCAVCLYLLKQNKKRWLLLAFFAVIFLTEVAMENTVTAPDVKTSAMIPSGIMCTVLLAVCFIAVKAVFEGKRTFSIIFSALTLLVSVFSATLIERVFLSGYNVKEYGWHIINRALAAGGAARVGTASACAVMLLMFMLFAIAVPSVLCLILSKNSKTE